MNRYEAEGIARDALDGKHVYVLSQTLYQAEHVISAVAAALPESSEVKFGIQELKLENGARVTAMSPRSTARWLGDPPEIVYTDVPWQRFTDHDQTADLDRFTSAVTDARKFGAEVVSRY